MWAGVLEFTFPGQTLSLQIVQINCKQVCTGGYFKSCETILALPDAGGNTRNLPQTPIESRLGSPLPAWFQFLAKFRCNKPVLLWKALLIHETPSFTPTSTLTLNQLCFPAVLPRPRYTAMGITSWSLPQRKFMQGLGFAVATSLQMIIPKEMM